jgi:RimJ/RimL family protein N-acetyltransferase
LVRIQGASKGAYLPYVTFDATKKTDQKTSKPKDKQDCSIYFVRDPYNLIMKIQSEKGRHMPQNRYPKYVVLKDGKEVMLRPLEHDDEEGLVRFYKDLQLSFRWFLKEDPCDPAVIKKWIDNQQAGKAFSILAIYEDRIVAHTSLLLRPYGGRKHVGRLRIMVVPDYRGKQLGTWMVFDLIRKGMEIGLEKIRSDFVVGVEDRAIEAFEKFDFIKEGLLKDYIKDEKGVYHDYQIMVKQLHKGWSDF